MSKAEGVLREFDRLCARRRALDPPTHSGRGAGRSEVRRGVWEALTLDPDAYDLDAPQRRLKTVFAIDGYRSPGSTPDFRAAHDAGERLYIPNDTHWNSRGNAWPARCWHDASGTESWQKPNRERWDRCHNKARQAGTPANSTSPSGIRRTMDQGRGEATLMNDGRTITPRRRPTMGALTLLIVGILPLAAPANAPEEAERQELQDRGWLVDTVQLTEGDRPGIQRLFASGRFLLPAAQVWDAGPGVGDTGTWPGITESVLEASNGDTSIRRYTLSIPLYTDRHYRLRKIHDRDRIESAVQHGAGIRQRPGDQGKLDGPRLSDSLTGLEYRLDTDPGVRWIPEFIVRWATKRMIPRTFAQVHRAANGPRSQSTKIDVEPRQHQSTR